MPRVPPIGRLMTSNLDEEDLQASDVDETKYSPSFDPVASHPQDLLPLMHLTRAATRTMFSLDIDGIATDCWTRRPSS